MIGLMLGIGNINQREYAGCRLDSVLEAQEDYELSLKLHLFDPIWSSIGSFGAYFSSDSATDYSINQSIYALPGQLQRDPDSIMSDFSIWYE